MNEAWRSDHRTISQLPGPGLTSIGHAARARFLPIQPLEWWYFAQVFYSVMGTALGLAIGSLGAAGLAALAGVCLLRAGPYRGVVIKAAMAPLACALSFIVVQTLMHGQSLLGDYNREYITWMFALVIVHYLALQRGFTHRFAAFAAVMGLVTLPYLRSFAGDASRAGLDKTITISNPNDLGAWFGFCCVYLVVLGLETRRNWIRALSWVAAGGCLLVIGLTVSRAPLFAVACSIVFAFRRILNRGFVPFLALIVVAWFAYALGVFESSATRFAQRGFEESGRLLVWPLAINRFLESPLTGVGTGNVGTWVPQAGMHVTPHNAFIFIALASGIVPLLFFFIYWVQLFATAFRHPHDSPGEASFHSTLLVYSFLIALNLNGVFQVPWLLVALAAVRARGLLRTAPLAAGARLTGRQGTRFRRAGDPWPASRLAPSQGHQPGVR
jgi:O-antigen ligase